MDDRLNALDRHMDDLRWRSRDLIDASREAKERLRMASRWMYDRAERLWRRVNRQSR